ncbi:hypothetical protein GCM10012275_45090 [Longimycelium tulufanense]|uniref:Uncharacterized protein n=1 Tax=Longimycelium tulufanense TaxID=907463 RepID=A0A8J3CJ33_9PSEU|nr:hypothetical protein GCM10012275_45090 [Longimycelium tulufanense]
MRRRQRDIGTEVRFSGNGDVTVTIRILVAGPQPGGAATGSSVLVVRAPRDGRLADSAPSWGSCRDWLDSKPGYARLGGDATEGGSGSRHPWGLLLIAVDYIVRGS